MTPVILKSTPTIPRDHIVDSHPSKATRLFTEHSVALGRTVARSRRPRDLSVPPRGSKSRDGDPVQLMVSSFEVYEGAP
jgi:hypothetical protein